MKRIIYIILLVSLLAASAVGLPEPAAAAAPPAQASGAALPLPQDDQPEPPGSPPAPPNRGWIEPAWLLSHPDRLGPEPGLAGDSFSTATGLTGIESTTPGDWENGWALGCILPLGATLNVALGASLAASPPFDLPPQLVEYAANLGLKLCAPFVLPPDDFEVDYNTQGGTCGYTFSQERTSGTFKNFYGITLPWGNIFPGKDWGDFNQPTVVHWNTDVNVSLKNPGWSQFDAATGEALPSNQYRLPTGVHSLVWRGDTLVNPADFVLLYIPGAAWLKLKKIQKLAKYADDIKDALDYGLLGLDLFLGEVLPSYPTGMFNEETQHVAVTDESAPHISSSKSGVIPIEAIEPGGVSMNTYLYALRRTLTVTDNCDSNPYLYPANASSLPRFAPVQSSYTVNWVAEDNGPQSLNGEVNTSSVLQQTFVVTDTLPPVILAPPDIVTETVSLPAQLNMGNPATFDLADLNPGVTHNACSRPGVVCQAGGVTRFPSGKTTVTWTATDHVGNTASATQLVNVKALNSNHAPTANSQIGNAANDAISFQPITLTLTAQDPDQDPLWFKIEDQPDNGFFHSPLYPYFIQDYRLANFQDISFRDYCEQLGTSGYVPTNWPVDANAMAVADDGTVYVHDHGMVFCGGTGDVHEDYRLAVFRPDGTWEQVADSFNTKDMYVDWRNGYIYTTSHNIGGTFDWLRRYDLDLNLVDKFRIDYADIVLRESKQGVMDDQGLIYVSNGFEYSGVAQLYIYDTTQGEHLVRVGNYSSSDLVFVDLALDSQNNLYASERNMDRVYKFSPMVRNPDGSVTPGEVIGWMGKCDSGPGCDSANGRSFGFSCTDLTCTLNTASNGSLPGQFDSPRGIALDPNDILYVTDYWNRRVQRFTPAGYFAGQAKSECDGSCFLVGDFGSPKQVTVNSSHFYVLDDNADLLHVFETTPLTRLNNNTAEIVYQSENNFTGVDSFSFTAGDGLASSAPASVQIKVSRNHRPPVANPVAPLAINEDDSVALPLSGYDPDEFLDTLSFQVDTPPDYGTVSGAYPNLVYVPDQDFVGVDNFTVVASDGALLSAPETVTVTVSAVNDVPGFPAQGEALPQGYAYRLAGSFVAFSRFAQLGTQDAPLQIGRGFSTAFTVNFFDPDDQDTHMVEIDWGDGSPLEPEGKLLEDGTATGPVLSEGQTGGSGSVSARHTFTAEGSYDVAVCISDNIYVDSNGVKSTTGASTTACKHIPVQVSAMTDLLLDVASSANPLALDAGLSYTLTLTNNPPESGTGLSATGIVISDTLDARLSVASADADGGACTFSGRQVTCQIDPLAPGESALVQVGVNKGPGLEAGNTLVNQAFYRLDQPNQSEARANLEMTTLVHPADYVVNTIEDHPDADPGDGACASVEGRCTLRAAVEQANATPGAQAISLADWQVLLSSELSITDDLTITGLGAGKTVLGGDGSSRLLSVADGAQVAVSDLSIQGGYSDQHAGGLYNAGDVALTRVQVSGNHAENGGGGLWNDGSMALVDSAVTGNDSAYGAGGISNAGSLTLHNVTVSGNLGDTGGGIGSTGTAALTNVTLAYNQAAAGGGLNGGPGNFSLSNTILWGNSAAAGPNCGYGFTSLGHNLIGDLADCTVQDQRTSDILGQDAGLDLLEQDGGDTLTHPLRGASPAIDAGSCQLPADQRGVARPYDGDMDQAPGCDIGAYEYVPTKLYLPLVIQ